MPENGYPRITPPSSPPPPFESSGDYETDRARALATPCSDPRCLCRVDPQEFRRRVADVDERMTTWRKVVAEQQADPAGFAERVTGTPQRRRARARRPEPLPSRPLLWVTGAKLLASFVGFVLALTILAAIASCGVAAVMIGGASW